MFFKFITAAEYLTSQQERTYLKQICCFISISSVCFTILSVCLCTLMVSMAPTTHSQTPVEKTMSSKSCAHLLSCPCTAEACRCVQDVGLIFPLQRLVCPPSGRCWWGGAVVAGMFWPSFLLFFLAFSCCFVATV